MDEKYGVLDELENGTFLFISVSKSGKVQHEYYEETEEGSVVPFVESRSPLDDIRYAGTFE